MVRDRDRNDGLAVKKKKVSEERGPEKSLLTKKISNK